MKTLSCDKCEQQFSANSFEEWFGQMRTHYMADHADVMAESANKTKEEGLKWVAAMKKKFDEA